MRRINLMVLMVVCVSICAEAITATETFRINLGAGSSVAYVTPTPKGYYVSNDNRIVFVSNNGDVNIVNIDVIGSNIVLGMDYKNGILVFLSGNPGFFAEIYLFDERTQTTENITRIVWTETDLPILRFVRWVGEGRLAIEMGDPETQMVKLCIIDLNKKSTEQLIISSSLETQGGNGDGTLFIVQLRDNLGRPLVYWLNKNSTKLIPDDQVVIDAAFMSTTTALLLHITDSSLMFLNNGDIVDQFILPSSNRIISIEFDPWTNNLITLERNSGKTILATYNLVNLTN